MSKPNESKLHIFRAGKHVTNAGDPMEFSAADLAQIAASYDPAIYRAPLVVGHPKVEDPAYGWADSLTATPEGLFAAPADVDAEFAAMVNAKRFPNISVALWPPKHPSNPKPDGYYLRHIGFLGAAAPAVKGLKQAQFNGTGDGIVQVEFSESAETADSMLRKFFALFQSEQASKSLQPATFAAPITNKGNTMTPEEITAARAELDKREKAIADREAKTKLDAVRAGNVAFAEQLAKDGKILPTQKGAVVSVLTALHSVAPAVEFAEGEGGAATSPADALRSILTAKKPVIDLSEKTPRGAVNAGAPVTFAAPPGFAVDQERAALHARVSAYAKDKGIEFAAAYEAVIALDASTAAAK